MMPMPNRIGQKFGSYELTQFLARGGFAEVYLGQHEHILGRQAAIKILFKQLVSTKSEQFKKEASLIDSLKHPHIVQLLDYGIYSNLALTTTLVPYIVMDYAPQGSVRKNHPRGVPLALATIVSYTRQIGEALQYAHDREVMHLDVKPENVLLGTQGQLLLSDFGLAAVLSEKDKITDIEGTLSYMSPEQLNGQPEFASDQYALAIMVYEWLSGNVPFTGQTTNEIIDKHLHMPPPSLCQMLPSLPAEVETVVMKALSKDPQRRYASVSQFATELEHAINQPGGHGLSVPQPFFQPAGGASPNSPFIVGPMTPTPFASNNPSAGVPPANSPFIGGPMPNTPFVQANNQAPFLTPVNPDSTTIVNPGLPPLPVYLQNDSNTSSFASSESSIMQITREIIKPKSASTRKREKPLLIAGIVAHSIAAIFMGVWVAKVIPSFGNEGGWWTFLFSLGLSIGAIFLFLTSRNKTLQFGLTIALGIYWCVVGFAFAVVIGAGTRIGFLPDANIMSVLFLLGSSGLLLWRTYKRK